MVTFYKRVFSLALKNFWRNLGLSLTTVLILIFALISFNVVLSVRAMTEAAIRLVEKKVDISLLFKVDAPDEKIEEMRSALARSPLVDSLVFKTRDEVLAEFKERHASEDEIISALAELESNPLGATLVIKAKKSENYEEMLKIIDVPEYGELIEQKTFEDHAAIIKKISAATAKTQKFAAAISLVLVLVAFLIIFNVIRVAIYTYREEISVMRLVGAGNWFIRAPFVFEVVFYSFLALAATIILIYIGLRFGDDYVKSFFNGDGFSLTEYFETNFFKIFGGEFLAMIILGIFSASLAMRRYLKV